MLVRAAPRASRPPTAWLAGAMARSPTQARPAEWRSRSSTADVGSLAASVCSNLNFCDQATTGRQKSWSTRTTIKIMAAIAQATARVSPFSTAVAMYDPMPGSLKLLFRTEIASDAARKNQPPPKLIMPFQTSPIMLNGTSSLTNRCHQVSW